MAITVSNREAITARHMVAVRNMAVAAGTSTDMVPPIVTQNKHRLRRRPASGDGSGTDITGFDPASENKRDLAERRFPPPWSAKEQLATAETIHNCV
jgi:hypothetical protein